jgi:hypothetical protein
MIRHYVVRRAKVACAVWAIQASISDVHPGGDEQLCDLPVSGGVELVLAVA